MLDFAKDKGFWKIVRISEDFSSHRTELEKKYKEAFKEPPRSHTAKEILGNNDKLYFTKLEQLQTSALLSLIYPENEEYYDNLVETIWAYCNDYTWAPLGHYNSYYNRTPQDYDAGLIDIFASSIAFSMAEIKNLFSDRFPSLLKDRISAEIRRRTIEPFLSKKFFWENHPNNWCAVCTGAVGGVLIYEAPEIYMEQIDRINSAMQVYLDSYKDDGICIEGAGYWGFGFGFFVIHALLQRDLTNQKYDWFKVKKVKRIATYLQKMFLQTEVVASFGDCSSNERYWVGLPHMLKSVYGEEIEKLPRNTARFVTNSHFAFNLRSILYFKKEYLAEKVKEEVVNYTEGSSFFTKRTKNYGLAIKGGNNGESHNHIDVGNFILARNNKQIICDPGAGLYEKGYHEEKRYTFFHPSSRAHNLPIFDGIGEDDVRRDDVCIVYDEKSEKATLDITNAYGRDSVKSVIRSFSFTDDTVTLTDTFDLDGISEIKEHFVSYIKPVANGKYVTIEDVTIYPLLECETRITSERVKTHTEGEVDAYLIDYILPKGTKEITIIISTSKK